MSGFFFQPENMHANIINIIETVIHGFLLKSFTVISCEFCKIYQKSCFKEQLQATGWEIIALEKQPPEVFCKKRWS